MLLTFYERKPLRVCHESTCYSSSMLLKDEQHCWQLWQTFDRQARAALEQQQGM
jgi:hypothetical protein